MAQQQLRALTFAELANAVYESLEGLTYKVTDADGETREAPISVVAVRDVLRSLGDVVSGEIASGYPVTVPGVAKLTLRYAPAKPRREVRNPRTGETQMAKPAPAKLRLKASPWPTLKAEVPSLRSQAGKTVEKVAESRARAAKRRARAREAVTA